FSIGEGVAYGSSVMNYVISGAPVSAFKVELSDEYFNVEFTGKDIRNWQKAEGGYVVQLHTPVSGAYTLLATYERPFKAQGDTLSQVVDRASLVTRISKAGQVLTDAHYFVKNRGNANFRLTLPEGTQLWSATVNGAPVVPVQDDKANLIPLPQQADPNAVLAI